MTSQEAMQAISAHLEKRYGAVYASRWLAQQTQEHPHTQLSEALSSAIEPSNPPTFPHLTANYVPRKTTTSTEAREAISQDQLPGQVSPTLKTVLSAPEATLKLTQRLETLLTPATLRTFRLLHNAALRIADRRGYAPSVSQVSFFCPLEVVGAALGIHRTTLWRHLGVLTAQGLLDYRPHKTSFRGQTVNDGTVWCIRLTPLKGKRPRLTYQELTHTYRNLEADVRKGRTAYALCKELSEPCEPEAISVTPPLSEPSKKSMQQSYNLMSELDRTNLILEWSLSPQYAQNPVMSDCCIAQAPVLETVLDLPYCTKDDRNSMVAAAASSICAALADAKSHAFYCQLLWNLLRHHDRGQDFFQQVYQMIVRARVDYQEGFARSAGGLLLSRLKRWKVWDHLQRTSPPMHERFLMAA
jgi:hypothetical protein